MIGFDQLGELWGAGFGQARGGVCAGARQRVTRVG